MRMNIIAIAVFLFGNMLVSAVAQAAVSNVNTQNSANTFLFIENQQDNDMFVAPNTRLDPRLTGANAWNSLKNSQQRSLAYVDNGVNQAVNGYNVDMWEIGPIQRPYTSQRCILGNPSCDSNGVGAQPTAIDNQGIYGMKVLYGWMHANISANFFSYIRSMPVGDTLVRQMHGCYTRLPYDAARGERCINQANGFYRVNTVSQQKVGHIKFIPTNNISQVIVDSNGNPFLLPGSSGCQNYVRGTRSGVLCDFLNYTFDHTGAIFNNVFVFTNIKDAALNSAINTNDVQMTADMLNWGTHRNGSGTAVGNRVNSLKSGNSVKIFLSSNFFKQVVRLGLQDRLTRDLINFNMSNGYAPDSGYYEFSGTTEVIIKPREFNVSILSSEGITNPYREGKIGKDVLSFQYKISESGPASADILAISLAQDRGTPYQGYCTFYPASSSTENPVPIPTTLMFNSTYLGNNYRHPIRCDQVPVNIRSLGIRDSKPADYWTDTNGDSGITRFYDLSLNFDLTDPMAARTTQGGIWEGERHQSGTLTIKGAWN